MSCFQNPILNETLVNNKINMVFLCGFTLDFNVGFTAINCSKLGFETYVIKDACKDFFSDESAKSMEKIFEKNNVKCIIMEQFEEIIKRVGEVKVEEEKNEEKKE